MVAVIKNKGAGWQEVRGIIQIALALLLLLSLLSYSPDDIPVLKSPPLSPAVNFIGPLGAWMAFILLMTLGFGAYLVPVFLCLLGLISLFHWSVKMWQKGLWLLVLLLGLLCIIELSSPLWPETMARLNLPREGGLLGYYAAHLGLVMIMGRVGTLIVAATLILASLVFVFEVHPKTPFNWLASHLARGAAWIREKVTSRTEEINAVEKEERALARKRIKLERAIKREAARKSAPEKDEETDQLEVPLDIDDAPTRKPSRPSLPRRKKEALPKGQKAEPSQEELVPAPVKEGDYHLPPMELIDPLPKIQAGSSAADLESGARVLEETLAEFGIEAEVTDVEVGPVVTRYQVLPAAGIRVERIAGLANNIGLSMKAESVRVQAPIPGKGVVGIELPNQKSRAVYMREVLETSEWKSGKAALPLALGQDVTGKTLVGDLADMPHLLIAGATGSGKTVCMNSILTGLLMSRGPDELRLMLVDPKIVEFSGYQHLPHLVVPVITDAKKVFLGLKWAIDEMERRYKMFAKVGVRNIKAFNSRPKIEQVDLFGGEAEEQKQNTIPDKVPYIAIIVDELADLMLVARADIENAIARLAQLSRAVGIHMILATQRPSVNVITGTIKANFPARIAFQVAQGNDSRTILDAMGAETLLGKGDMLFLPPGSSRLIRAQGTFTKDHEIEKVVDFVKSQGTPEYESAVKDKIESKKADLPDIDTDDELLEPAIEIIRQTKRASTSSLQRRLRIGYTRAARLMDLLEEKGMVGPPRGSDPREILIDLDGDIPQNQEASGDEEERV